MAKICGSGATCELLCPVVRPGRECASLLEFASVYVLPERLAVERREVVFIDEGKHVHHEVE